MVAKVGDQSPIVDGSASLSSSMAEQVAKDQDVMARHIDEIWKRVVALTLERMAERMDQFGEPSSELYSDLEAYLLHIRWMNLIRMGDIQCMIMVQVVIDMDVMMVVEMLL